MGLLDRIDEEVYGAAVKIASSYHEMTGGSRAELAVMAMVTAAGAQELIEQYHHVPYTVDPLFTAFLVAGVSTKMIVDERTVGNLNTPEALDYRTLSENNFYRKFGYVNIAAGIFFVGKALVYEQLNIEETVMGRVWNGITYATEGMFFMTVGLAHHIMRTPPLPPGKNVFARIANLLKPKVTAEQADIKTIDDIV